MQQQSEADLVAAFLAKGGSINRCPTGASTYNIEYVWSDKIHRLVPRDVEAATAIYRKSMTRSLGRKKTGPTPEQIKRRETVVGLMDQGHTGAAIAKMIGCDCQTVYNDAKVMGRSFPRPAPEPREYPGVAERRAKVRALIAAGGKSAPQIAVGIGAAESTVYNDARVMGISLKKGRSKKECSAKPLAMIADRRKRLPALIARGMTTADIARKFNTTSRSIRHDCRVLRIPSPSKAQKPQVAA